MRRWLNNADDDLPGGANDDGPTSDAGQLKSNIYINCAFFFILVSLFELTKHFKSIFMKRLTKKKYSHSVPKRVPEIPPKFLFGWIYELGKIS